MFLVGLTGGIATGKSTVSGMFSELGVVVIDADLIAREVVQPGQKAWKQIKSEFGNEVLKMDASGEIDRVKLGDIVFNDREKRRRLDAITHPEVYNKIFWMVIRCFFQGHQFVILDLPLLMESAATLEYIYKVIVVSCDEDQQLNRLMSRNGLPESDAQKRIKAQMPLDLKCQRAHIVIDNSGSMAETRHQVQLVCKTLRRSNHHWKLRLIIAGSLLAAGAVLIWLGMIVWPK